MDADMNITAIKIDIIFGDYLEHHHQYNFIQGSSTFSVRGSRSAAFVIEEADHLVQLSALGVKRDSAIVFGVRLPGGTAHPIGGGSTFTVDIPARSPSKTTTATTTTSRQVSWTIPEDETSDESSGESAENKLDSQNSSCSKDVDSNSESSETGSESSKSEVSEQDL